MRNDLFDGEIDLFGEEQNEIDDLFPEFNPPTETKKEQKNEISQENKGNEGQH